VGARCGGNKFNGILLDCASTLAGNKVVIKACFYNAALYVVGVSEPIDPRMVIFVLVVDVQLQDGSR